MDIFTVLISVVIWALIFAIIWWGGNKIAAVLGAPPIFNKIFVVLYVLCVMIVFIGLLTGHVQPVLTLNH